MAAVPGDLVRAALAIAGLSDAGNANARQTTRFMTANSITDVEDFASLEADQVREMVKQYQRAHAQGTIGITVQNRLKGLIWWARDKKRRGQPIDTAVLDIDMLEAAREDYEMYKRDVEAGSKITALEKFNPKQEFSSWDDIVTEALDQRMGAQEASISYVIRPNQPVGFVPRNNKEELRYALPLTGPKYRADNGVVYSMLSVATLGTIAYTYVENFKHQLDGRAAMMALRDHYDGDATTNRKLTKYQGIISNIEYINERTATWENQLTKLIEAYQWMQTRANQPYTDDIKVVKLCTMIRVANNNALAIAVEYMRNNFRADFDGAVTYITGRINEINAHKPLAATRQISQTRKTSWNRINITNPERDFLPTEWEQLKPDGQKLVIQYRNENRVQRNPGRGRGRGYGRGYEYTRGGYGRGGRGGRGRSRGRGRGDNRKNDNSNNDRKTQEVNTTTDDKKLENTPSGKTVTMAQPAKGGSAGAHFK